MIDEAPLGKLDDTSRSGILQFIVIWAKTRTRLVLFFKPGREKMEPDEVFTPRSSVVNPEMYVSRNRLEVALQSALSGSRNIVIHGESGCGKSWLFKRIFHATKTPYMVVNMANAARLNGLNNALEDRFAKFKTSIQSGITSAAELKGGVFGIGASLKEVETIEQLYAEPLERCMELISNKKKDAFIVFENLERVLSDEKIIDDLSNIIVLLDDEDYAQYRVRIVLIGVPDDLQRYFMNSKFSQTISNRLVEIPEVERLGIDDASRLVKKGFVDLLNYDVESDSLIRSISWLSDYIPQYIHELGLEVAKVAKDERVLNAHSLQWGVYNWVRTSFTADYSAIEDRLNSRQTKAGRRNQTIYSLGQIRGIDFRASDVESEVRSLFPGSTDNITLNITQILSDLSEGERPLIRRTPKGDAYRFASPKLKVCIRCMLRKDEDERVYKLPIDETFEVSNS